MPCAVVFTICIFLAVMILFLIVRILTVFLATFRFRRPCQLSFFQTGVWRPPAYFLFWHIWNLMWLIKKHLQVWSGIHSYTRKAAVLFKVAATVYWEAQNNLVENGFAVVTDSLTDWWMWAGILSWRHLLLRVTSRYWRECDVTFCLETQMP